MNYARNCRRDGRTRGREGERKRGTKEEESAAHERVLEDAGARDTGRRSSTTLHCQLHPSHTRYESCSRATLHRDTRRTIVASAPTGGTSSSSIFTELVGARVRRHLCPEIPLSSLLSPLSSFSSS